jgi:hypothetical protein
VITVHRSPGAPISPLKHSTTGLVLVVGAASVLVLQILAWSDLLQLLGRLTDDGRWSRTTCRVSPNLDGTTASSG